MMQRYALTFAVALVFTFGALLGLYAAYEDFGETTVGAGKEMMVSGAFWPIVGIFFFLTALSIWGMVGVLLSSLKEKARDLAGKEAVISRKSWHYGLNVWANLGDEPPKTCSECEYWVRLVHGLSLSPWGYVLVAVAVTFAWLVAWLCSKRVGNPIAYIRGMQGTVLFKNGHQLVGPAVLALLLLGGLALGLMLSGTYEGLTHAPWPTIGKWLGIGVISMAGIVVVLCMLIFGIWPKVLAPPLSYAGARIAGVCRPVRFTN